METVEEVHQAHNQDTLVPNFQYYNAKEMLMLNEPLPPNETNSNLDDRSIKREYIPPMYINLTTNPHFFNTPVNMSLSSVHIPTNVFDRSK